nr:reverse transcriptase domain-containing protein [Tanacetum cinerariifolium]
MRNTLGKEQASQSLVRPVSDEDLREYYDKNFHQILPIIAEKLHQEKAQQEKLKAVKARLNFEEASQYSDSETPNRRRNLKERLGPRDAQTRSGSPKQMCGRSKSPMEKGPERRTVFKRLEKGVFHRLGDKEKNVSHIQEAQNESHTTVVVGTQKAATKVLALKKQKLLPRNIVTKESILGERKQCQKVKDVQEGTGSQNQRSKSRAWRTTYPNHGHIKTYDGSEDLEDHLKIFQAAAETERWVMPTWCHMFNSTLTENAKHSLGGRWRPLIRNGRSRFHHGNRKPNRSGTSKRGNFRNEKKMERKQDRFTLLTKTAREILTLNKGKFKPPPPMTTLVEKRNASKFCEFHGEVGHTNDECMHLKKKIEEMLKAGKLSHLIKKLKQNHEKDQAKITKKGKPRVISFPTLGEEDGTEGSMIIEAEMGGHYQKPVDSCKHPLVGFSGEKIWPLGQISLLVKVGDEEHSTSTWMNFMVVRSPSHYNGIIGRPRVRKIRAIPSTAHEMIKFPVADGIVTLQSSRIIPLECSMVSKPGVSRSARNQVREEKIQVAIHLEHSEQTVAIGSTLIEEGRKKLCGLLRRHLDVFAWKPADMTGVPRHIAEHRLNVREGCLHVRQKKRGQAPERNKAISEEVKKLVEADIIKEVNYHSWLSILVMVKKHDDNMTGVPRNIAEHRLNVREGCLPVRQKKRGQAPERNKAISEEVKKLVEADIIKEVNYHSWLSNLVMTKKRWSNLPAFSRQGQKQIGQNLEVYVDDLVIKSRTEKEVIRDTEETFKTLRKINMKLNPKKYAFGMREGTFLGYKVDAVLDLSSPKCLKDVQKLNWKLASLNRFLSKSAEKSLPIFKTLKSAQRRVTSNGPGSRRGIQRNETIDSVTFDVNGAKGKGGVNYVYGRCKRGHQRSIDDREEWEASACLLRMEFTYALRFRFNTTNNEPEYEALIAGFRIASQMGIQNLQENVDLKLVANQVNRIYIAKESSMIRYLEKVKNLANTFKGFSIKQIPRGENKKADTLSKIVSTSFAHLSKQVLVEELKEKEIDKKEILAVVEEEGHTWMTLVYEYLTEGILPEEKRKQGLCPARQEDMP